jgi:hypothetical protein
VCTIFLLLIRLSPQLTLPLLSYKINCLKTRLDRIREVYCAEYPDEEDPFPASNGLSLTTLREEESVVIRVLPHRRSADYWLKL